jgi:hypothetical protein
LFMDALFECESGCGQSIAVHRAWRVLRAEERSIRARSTERGRVRSSRAITTRGDIAVISVPRSAIVTERNGAWVRK